MLFKINYYKYSSTLQLLKFTKHHSSCTLKGTTLLPNTINFHYKSITFIPQQLQFKSYSTSLLTSPWQGKTSRYCVTSTRLTLVVWDAGVSYGLETSRLVTLSYLFLWKNKIKTNSPKIRNLNIIL